MSKTATTPETKGSKKSKLVAPDAPAAEPKAATLVSDAPAAETKVPTSKSKHVDRDTCKLLRGEMDARARIAPTDKANDIRMGSLRYNIVEAVRSSATVIEACEKKVIGSAKHHDEATAYTIKKVDVGFAVANGYVKLLPKD